MDIDRKVVDEMRAELFKDAQIILKKVYKILENINGLLNDPDDITFTSGLIQIKAIMEYFTDTSETGFLRKSLETLDEGLEATEKEAPECQTTTQPG